MFGLKTAKIFRKLTETKNNRKSLSKEISKLTDWKRMRKLIEKDYILYRLELRRSSKLTALFGIRIYSSAC
ncbi:hypothetical protein A3H87_01825 [Candidatus Curtissbacteria bacterium RIFCSPLOWO2_02_FULL_42_37]|uniref:Uncharacterized protein n=2 Tax=Candidatus Curtissiibacteriota TaxID=1752717 RepID=A0A1F5H7R4_9BACT|nr:MAG: hypothetical protein A2693_03190 [Candidatus Curtissbacteria bacterium RIFCSPHIGHO2_01_FULL_40_12]OGD92331.1 MAG: hypothetical protein A3C33_01410 [Candidatus Curtissbacteria bacterium RIFCSPHIGHO2_02_FULL_42_58]OGD96998.1 MAG: hypothetical protein A3E71_01495 [Candidatus Curtissbacteria bacterium RIFCSPHIGHO2_12_FULL_42_33]OGE00207.1 MAG: hypothetical protein A3B54_02490 [Candidatus Curtissbacteria bacterium RIFCSPLOWO2_01_FULL_42_50]OGE09997.1 MAG: hypothetical protein A3H87_01825 [Ca